MSQVKVFVTDWWTGYKQIYESVIGKKSVTTMESQSDLSHLNDLGLIYRYMYMYTSQQVIANVPGNFHGYVPM